jgi:hypothetical protein
MIFMADSLARLSPARSFAGGELIFEIYFKHRRDG